MNFRGCHAAEELVQGAFYPEDKQYMFDINSPWCWTIFFGTIISRIISWYILRFWLLRLLLTASWQEWWFSYNSGKSCPDAMHVMKHRNTPFELRTYKIQSASLFHTSRVVGWSLESPSSGLLLWSEAPAGYTIWTSTNESRFYLM